MAVTRSVFSSYLCR